MRVEWRYMLMEKSTRWAVIVGLLFTGALLAPLVGFPDKTIAELWSTFNYGYQEDYLTLTFDGPEETTVNSPQIAYTFTVNNVDAENRATTGTRVIATSSSSINWDTAGTPCSSIPASVAAIEDLKSAKETGEVISVMWQLLASAESEQFSASGSSVLFCELGTLAGGSSRTFDLAAIPTEVGTHTITGFVICNEAEESLDNNVATITTEVKHHQLFLPIIIR